MEKLLLSISTLAFFGFVIMIWIRFGLLSSISDGYYYLNRQKHLFAIAMVGVGLPVTIQSDTGMIFFAGLFICMAGAAGYIREDFTEKLHIVGATGGITLSMVSLWIDYGMWWVSLGFAVISFLLTFFRINHSSWWIEILAFVSVILVLWGNVV